MLLFKKALPTAYTPALATLALFYITSAHAMFRMTTPLTRFATTAMQPNCMAYHHNSNTTNLKNPSDDNDFDATEGNLARQGLFEIVKKVKTLATHQAASDHLIAQASSIQHALESQYKIRNMIITVYKSYQDQPIGSKLWLENEKRAQRLKEKDRLTVALYIETNQQLARILHTS